MAWEGRELGLKVLVIPTTHMALPEHFCAGTFGGGFGADIKRQWDCGCGKSGGTKARREKDILLGLGILPAGQRKADLVLVEADGAKRLPVKVPGPAEPVIPGDTDLILCVYGLKALGQKGEKCCFRMEQAKTLLGESFSLDKEDREWAMEEKYMAYLMKQGYLSPLKQSFPQARILPVFNQADTGELVLAGKRILEQIGHTEGLITGNLWKEPSFELF